MLFTVVSCQNFFKENVVHDDDKPTKEGSSVEREEVRKFCLLPFRFLYLKKFFKEIITLDDDKSAKNQLIKEWDLHEAYGISEKLLKVISDLCGGDIQLVTTWLDEGM